MASAVEAKSLRQRTEVHSYKVEHLLDFVRIGRVRIPDFQRPQRWRSNHVIELFDSILKGYPIGSLLFAVRSLPGGRVRLGAFEVEAPPHERGWMVVDGQQRISALAGALMHPEVAPRGDIHAVWYDLESRSLFQLKRSEAPETAVPLRVLGSAQETLRWLRRWPLNSEREDLTNLAIEVGTTLREFPLSCTMVSDDPDDDEPLREIFRRTNNAGVKMREEDVFRALYAREQGEATALARVARSVAETGFGPIPEDQVRHCVIAVAGLDPGTASHDPSLREKMGTVLPDTERALRAACSFLIADVGIPHVALLPYAVPLRLLARFFSLYAEPSPRARTLLRRWVWRGIVSELFASSSQGLVRRLQSLVTPNDAEDAASALLSELGSVSLSYDVTSERWIARGARSRVVALALIARSPQDPRDGEPLTADVAQRLLVGAPEEGDDGSTRGERDEGALTLSEFVVDACGRSHAEQPTLAGRVATKDGEGRDALPDASEDVLRAHLISPEAAAVLRELRNASDQSRSALQRRFDLLRGPMLQAWVHEFLEVRCEPAANDRVSIARLLRTMNVEDAAT